MDVTEFTTYLVKNIVKNPDMVKVSSFLSDDEDTIIEIIVSKEDMGAVIGRQGKIAYALRTIIKAQAYLNNIKRLKINIDAF